jgi:sulfite exporter TauE/SafE
LVAITAAVLLVFTGLAAVPQASATSGTAAAPQATYYRALIRNKQTLRCLSSNSAGSPSTVACNSASTYQQWRFDITASQRIWNVATGRCLTYAVVTGSHTGAVSTQSCNGSASQTWLAHPTGVELTYLGQRALDSNSQGVVYTLPSSGSQYQIWQKIYFSTP